MQIEHLAIWTHDLERLKEFYVTYFGGQPNDRYTNPRTGFSSYFLSFEAGPRLELMQMPGILASHHDFAIQFTGLVHLAFSTGSQRAVDALTERLRQAGYRVMDGPRTTGDGYYESVVLDPDGNRVEITV